MAKYKVGDAVVVTKINSQFTADTFRKFLGCPGIITGIPNEDDVDSMYYLTFPFNKDYRGSDDVPFLESELSKPDTDG